MERPKAQEPERRQDGRMQRFRVQYSGGKAAEVLLGANKRNSEGKNIKRSLWCEYEGEIWVGYVLYVDFIWCLPKYVPL